MDELSQSLHHRIAKELATRRAVASQCGFNAARLEQLAVAIPSLIYAVCVKKQGVTWV